MRYAMLRKIDRVRKKLIVSIETLRKSEDPQARARVLVQEFAADALLRLPQLVHRHATQADAIILTQAQLRELLAQFALEVLALHNRGTVRELRSDE